jgi:hypothetical protein
MPILENYHTEAELVRELKHRLGFGEVRTLRMWRARRTGPPWARIGHVIVYPNDRFEDWLRSRLRYPVRGRGRRNGQRPGIRGHV